MLDEKEDCISLQREEPIQKMKQRYILRAEIFTMEILEER